MNITLKNLNLKKIDAPYSIGYIDDFLNENYCKKLFEEIYSFNGYDDLVMNGRMRVNKGSERFINYMNNSPNLKYLYECLNNQEFFIEMENKLKIYQDSVWLPEINNFVFSKKEYGEQKFNLTKFIRRSWIVSNFLKKTINLDIDFSRSKKGYFRKAHRDRDTRVISFLLYLNTIEKDLGGEFEVYKMKQKITEIKKLKRFPNNEEISLIDKFSPKSGQLFIFLSTPDSYHGVSKFLSEDTDRVFIYGSYSLNRKVVWKFNDK